MIPTVVYDVKYITVYRIIDTLSDIADATYILTVFLMIRIWIYRFWIVIQVSWASDSQGCSVFLLTQVQINVLNKKCMQIAHYAMKIIAEYPGIALGFQTRFPSMKYYLICHNRLAKVIFFRILSIEALY